MNRRRLFLTGAKAALATAFGTSWLCGTAQAQTTQSAGAVPSAPALNHTILPIPEPKPPMIDVLDARNVIPPSPWLQTASAASCS
jgi:hypothetical protein